MNDMPSYQILTHRRTEISACLRVALIAVIVMGSLFAGSHQVIAQSLATVRASGMVGERYDGFAEARASASSAAKKLVNKVNSQRRKIYAKQAREKKVSAAEVGKLFARRIVAKVPKGTWILPKPGSWKRK
jgi:uncharacterized protein YdbL (DUF1318 family)